jgi:hypothetical protein
VAIDVVIVVVGLVFWGCPSFYIQGVGKVTKKVTESVTIVVLLGLSLVFPNYKI